MHSVKDLWEAVLEQLRQRLTRVSVETWFEGIEAVELTENTLCLYCGSGFRVMILEQRYMPLIRECLAELLAGETEICFLTEEQYRARQSKGAPAESSLTFDTFVVGSSNRMAYAAARAVAEQGGCCGNPLVIYGDTGLGKTHLLNAVAAEVRAREPEARVVFSKGDSFVNELVDSIRTGNGGRFREKYRSADCFLIDDVQFIAGKHATQEEFFNTFEALYEAGCRIVLAMDRPPRELETLEKRLRGRFEGGLMVEVAPPDYETRLAIVREKARLRELTLSEEDAALIAERLPGSVRRIEGLLNQLKEGEKLARQTGAEPPAVSRVLAAMAGPSHSVNPGEESIRKVCEAFSLSRAQLLGRSRGRTETLARQIAFYLLCRRYGLSASEAGRVMGRDHTAALYSMQSLEKKMKDDPLLKQRVEQLSGSCG